LIPDAIPFVNADEIARAQVPDQDTDMNRQAARIMLFRLNSLQNERLSFAVETTLASRALATRIVSLKAKGYRFHLYYMWIDSADLAVQRIAERVRMGGHNIPEQTVRRRYKRSIINFANIYKPLANRWHIYNNRTGNIPELVADGDNTGYQTVYEQDSWNELLKESGS
jgi:predicted ABC-type ATPase